MLVLRRDWGWEAPTINFSTHEMVNHYSIKFIQLMLKSLCPIQLINTTAGVYTVEGNRNITGCTGKVTILITLECPETVGGEPSVGPLPDTCGYNCTAEFKCNDGPGADSCCSAKAVWEPALSCIPGMS